MKNIKGIKATCSETKRIGSYSFADHVAVYFDRDANEVVGIFLTAGGSSRSRRVDFDYVTTYWEPTSMAQIRADIEEIL